MNERRGEWEQGVDRNLASLNSGQRTQDEKLERLESNQEDIDGALHGETDSGLIGRIEDLETEVSRLNAVIFQDDAGTKGLHHDIQALLSRREDRRDRWANWTKIIIAIITTGTIGIFWRDIKAYVEKQKPEAFMQMFEKPKRPQSKRHKRKVAPKPLLDIEEGQ